MAPIRTFCGSTVGVPHPGVQVVFTGSVQGNEFKSPLALPDLARRLDDAALRGRVPIVLFVNAPPLGAGTGTGRFDGLNPARNFPGGDPTALCRTGWRGWSGAVPKMPMRWSIDIPVGSNRAFCPSSASITPGWGSGRNLPPSCATDKANSLPDLWRLSANRGVLSSEAVAHRIVVTGCGIG